MEIFGTSVVMGIVLLILVLLAGNAAQNITRERLVTTCEAELPRNQQCELIAVPKEAP